MFHKNIKSDEFKSVLLKKKKDNDDLMDMSEQSNDQITVDKLNNIIRDPNLRSKVMGIVNDSII